MTTVVGGEWHPTKLAKASEISLTLLGAYEFLNPIITFWIVTKFKMLRGLDVLQLK